jgi:hypothetical protein
MSISVPNLGNSKCVIFTVCGSLETKDMKVLKWLKAGQRLAARVRSGGRTYLLSAIAGQAFENHFHIDLASVDFFNKKDLPSPTHSLKELLEQIEITVGSTCTVRVEGTFDVSISDLPPLLQNFIKIATTSTSVGGVKIQTTGGSLSVEGTPVQNIRWQVFGTDDVMIELNSNQTVTVTESYLEESWQSINQTFTRLIQGDAPSGKRKK